MYLNLQPFGIQIYGKSLGDAWLSLVAAILRHGEKNKDEKRDRIALQNIRIKINKHNPEDEIIKKFGDKNNLKELLDMFFDNDKMKDFDVVPSFKYGAKSYHRRIKEGLMDKFVVERLSLIPESKKAVMVFPTYEDYKAVLENPWDDYLPCIVAIQFRLIEQKNKWVMNTIFFARSIDAFQKLFANFVAISKLAYMIKRRLKLKKKVEMGAIDGFITDVHIYKESIAKAKNLEKKLDKYIW